MKIIYHKSFFKDAEKVSASKTASEILKTLIVNINAASRLADIVGCKPLSGVKHAYRIRRGDYRILLLYKDNIVYLRRVVLRGQAYTTHSL
jgi:mRNA-degrading endonuclease RelE of RelBE toxin-antitoxin system